MKSTPLFARRFATDAHADQKYGDAPYVFHLEQVSKLVELWAPHYFDTHQVDLLKQAAWLHDVLEDTPITHTQITTVFGEEVSRLVLLVTDEPGEDRGTRKKITYIKTRTSPLAVFLKLCDRLANIQASTLNSPSLLEKYRNEHPSFEKALKHKGEFTLLWKELDESLS